MFTLAGLIVVLILGAIAGVAVFLIVMDIAHWNRRGPAGFDVQDKPPRR